MKVSIKRGDEVVYSSISTKEVIEKPASARATSGLIKVSIGGGSKSVTEEKKISNESGIKASIGKKDDSSNAQPNRAANGRFVSKNTNKNTVKNTSSAKKVETKTVVEESKNEPAQEFIFEDDTKVDDEVVVPEVTTDDAVTTEETNLDFEVDGDESEEDDTSDTEESNSSTFGSDDTDDYSMYDDDEMFAGTRTPIRRSNKRSSDGEGSRSSSYKKGSSTKVSKKK